MTAFGASDSLSPPTVGHPWESPVPGDDEWTTAKAAGYPALATCDLEMIGRSPFGLIGGGFSRWGGTAPISCFVFQR